MMYSDIQANVQAILNRRDVTPTQLQTFISLAIQRIQRVLRVPSMESTTLFVTSGANGIVTVPGDLLELIALSLNDTTNIAKLTRVDLQSALRLASHSGTPTSYYRDGPTFIIAPYPPYAATVSIRYYKDATSLSAPTDHNWMTDVIPDLLIYAALSYASDFFIDDRKGSFDARCANLIEEIQVMAHNDELMNASISMAYNSDTDYTNSSWGY